jgi:hypothetical protein
MIIQAVMQELDLDLNILYPEPSEIADDAVTPSSTGMTNMEYQYKH